MRNLRTWRPFAALSAALLATGLLTPPPAGAVEFSAAKTILDSACTKWMKWNGGLPEGMGHAPDFEPGGTVKLCWVKYRLKSDDDRADYYAMSLQSTWTVKRGNKSYPAEMQHATDSTIRSMGRVFGSTGNYTSSHECSQPVTIGFSVGPIGVSTSPKICNSYGIQRYKSANDKAYWRSSRAGGLRSIETAFVQKVPQGRVPKFDAVFAIPRYRVKYYEAGGYWTSTKQFKWVSWTDR